MQEYVETVRKIVEKELEESPLEVERIKTGICNEVFAVRLPLRSVIVRINADEALLGSGKFYSLLRSLGVAVPEILASNHSKCLAPYAYQIQTRLEGRDMGEVICDLSDDELRSIAKEIAKITKLLAQIPTGGRFGENGDDERKLFDSWTAVLKDKLSGISERNAQTGIVGKEYINIFGKTLERYRSYFEGVVSTMYFDDMNSKNVLVHSGKFSGLVDIDSMAYGDPLEAVGRIMASWYGTAYGTVYAGAVMDELELDERQREIVTVYALQNRISWLSEKGIRFNRNTSDKIDHEAARKDRQIIELIIKKLHL